MDVIEDFFLQRILGLAARGAGAVSPNPLVGALLVYNGRIVAEGWHKLFGGPHAEVEAINQVKDKALLSACTLYVSLEPCNHHGKTPPCTELIIAKGIRKVVVGCKDPNPRVQGQGITRLRAAGIEALLADDPQPFIKINRAFFVNQILRRPYVILKWAQTADGYMGSTRQRLQISGTEALRWGHALRAHTQAVLVGTNTALADDPTLSTRYFTGRSPLRIVLDKSLRLPPSLNVFKDGNPTWVLNGIKHGTEGNITYWKPERPNAWNDWGVLLHELYHRNNIASILVEGGAHVLQQLLDAELYDELHVYQSDQLLAKADVRAPMLKQGMKLKQQRAGGQDALFTTFVPRISELDFIRL